MPGYSLAIIWGCTCKRHRTGATFAILVNLFQSWFHFYREPGAKGWRCSFKTVALENWTGLFSVKSTQIPRLLQMGEQNKNNQDAPPQRLHSVKQRSSISLCLIETSRSRSTQAKQEINFARRYAKDNTLGDFEAYQCTHALLRTKQISQDANDFCRRFTPRVRDGTIFFEAAKLQTQHNTGNSHSCARHE